MVYPSAQAEEAENREHIHSLNFVYNVMNLEFYCPH